MKVATERFDDPTTPATVDRELREGEAASMHAEHLQGRLRGLTSRCVRHAVCLYTVAPDFGFVLDAASEHGHVVVASPCSGHGFKHSAAIGECAAALALELPSPVDVTPFRRSRL